MGASGGDGDSPRRRAKAPGGGGRGSTEGAAAAKTGVARTRDIARHHRGLESPRGGDSRVLVPTGPVGRAGGRPRERPEGGGPSEPGEAERGQGPELALRGQGLGSRQDGVGSPGGHFPTTDNGLSDEAWVLGGRDGLHGRRRDGTVVGRDGARRGGEPHLEPERDGMAKPRRDVCSPRKITRLCQEGFQDTESFPGCLPVTKTAVQAAAVDGRKGGSPAVHHEMVAEAGKGSRSPSAAAADSSAAASSNPAPQVLGEAADANGQLAGGPDPEVPEIIENIRTDLLETGNIMDIDYVEQWLVQKEQEATESYFQTYAPGPQRLWHNKWLSSLQDYSQSASVSRCDRIWWDSDCSDLPLSGLSRLIGRIGPEQDRVCIYSDLVKANSKAMHSLREFLCQSLLEPELELEVLALKIIGAAANNRRNLLMIGGWFKLIGPLLIKSLIGSPDTQVLALNLLARLSRIHSNRVMILNLGGFSFATHLLKVAAHGAEPAARLLLFLLQSEYSHAKILKDHLAYNVIKAVGQRKVMDPTIIESIIEETSRFHLAQSLWFDALVILKPGSTSRNYLFGVLSKSASRAVEDDEEG